MVSFMSLLLGLQSPLGWLWTKIMLVELVIIADLKTSIGVVFIVLIEPIATIDTEVI